MARFQYRAIYPDGRPAQLLLLPQTVAGSHSTYHVDAVLNFDPQTGRMGSGQALLYRATDRSTGSRVALKQLLRPDDADARERHRRERDFLLSGQTHPNIVRGIEAFSDGKEEFIVMRWIEGATLAQRLQQHGILPEVEVVDHLKTLARTLHFLHRAGWLFRDLAEGNILFPSSACPPLVLIDFGGILSIRSAPRHTRLLPPSVAPEVSLAYQQGRQAAFSPASEVYALGAIGYFMATGQYVPDDRLAHPLPPPRSLTPHLSPALETLILRMLEMDPRQRPGAPLDVVRALEALQAGNAPSASSAPPSPAIAVWPPASAPLPAAGPARSQMQDWFGRFVQDLQSRGMRAWRRHRAALLSGGAGLCALSLLGLVIGHAVAPVAPTAATFRGGSKPTPTAPAPHAAPTKPFGSTAPLWGRHIRLRASPALNGSVLGELSAPKRVRVLGRVGGWRRIMTGNGLCGYVWGAFVPEGVPYRRGTLRVSLPAHNLDAGGKVLVTSAGKHAATLLLPDGARATVAPSALTLQKR